MYSVAYEINSNSSPVLKTIDHAYDSCPFHEPFEISNQVQGPGAKLQDPVIQDPGSMYARSTDPWIQDPGSRDQRSMIQDPGIQDP
jgi:hypothetical protein